MINLEVHTDLDGARGGSMYLEPGQDPYIFVVTVDRDDFMRRDEINVLTVADDLPHIPFNFNNYDEEVTPPIKVVEGCGNTACLGY